MTSLSGEATGGSSRLEAKVKNAVDWRIVAYSTGIAGLFGLGLHLFGGINWFASLAISLFSMIVSIKVAAFRDGESGGFNNSSIVPSNAMIEGLPELPGDGVSVPGSKLKRHPKSVPGDFYVVNGMCLSCGAPHVVAPDLLGWADDEMSHCIWKKQPSTQEEFEQALAAFAASETECYRYAGNDPKVMARLGPDFCDRA